MLSPDRQANMANVIAALQKKAGPRGATYAGRVVTPTDTPQSVMARLPTDSPDAEGMNYVPMIGAGVSQLSKTIDEMYANAKKLGITELSKEEFEKDVFNQLKKSGKFTKVASEMPKEKEPPLTVKAMNRPYGTYPRRLLEKDYEGR